MADWANDAGRKGAGHDDAVCDGGADDEMADDEVRCGGADDEIAGDEVCDGRADDETADDEMRDGGADDGTAGDETIGDVTRGDAGLGGVRIRAGAARRDAAGRFVARAGSSESATRRRARRRTGGRRAVARKPVAWSARREALFLETLAGTSCVAEAIRTSGFSETNVYRRKRTCAAFRARWAEALREGYGRLQGMLLDRALNGIEVPVYHGGKRVGTKREFNDGTALALLRMHREAVMGAQPVAADEPIEVVRARVKAKLSEMNKRMGGGG